MWSPVSEKCEPSFDIFSDLRKWKVWPLQVKSANFFWHFFGPPTIEKCDPLRVKSANFLLEHTIIWDCLKNFLNFLWIFLKFYSKFILSFLFHSGFIWIPKKFSIGFSSADSLRTLQSRRPRGLHVSFAFMLAALFLHRRAKASRPELAWRTSAWASAVVYSQLYRYWKLTFWHTLVWLSV